MKNQFEIRIYKTAQGKAPFEQWLNKLDDSIRMIVDARLERICVGNLGDCKALRQGAWEIKINYGPGYRIYFGKIKDRIILLLCAGNKNSQKKDIEKAIKYWLHFKEEP